MGMRLPPAGKLCRGFMAVARVAPYPRRLCSSRHPRHGEGLFIQSGNKLSTGRRHYKTTAPHFTDGLKNSSTNKTVPPAPRCRGNLPLSHFRRADLKSADLTAPLA